MLGRLEETDVDVPIPLQRSGKLISGYIYNYIAYFRASLDVTPREGAVGPKKSRSCSPSVGLPIPVLAARLPE